MGKSDNGKSPVAAGHTKHAAAATTTTTTTTTTTNKSVPSYHDKDGNIHYPALKSTHRHFLDQGVLLIWRCGRCTSRNAAEATDCGGCGCGHRRCGRDCEWLMRKGVGGKKLPPAAAATKGQGSGLQQQAQLPEQWQNAGSDEVASGAGGGGQVGGAAADNDVEDDNDDAVHLPTPPHEMTERQGAADVAESTFVEQTQSWTCCYCGKDGNPTAAASCPMALCGHIRCASHCATRVGGWVR